MRHIAQLAAALLATIGGGQGALAAAPSAVDRHPPPMTITGDKLDRAVDCRGADVRIASSDSALKLSHCDSIVVAGSRDRIDATLLESSEILVLGDHDVIRWTAFPGASPVVTDRGKRNTAAPF